MRNRMITECIPLTRHVMIRSLAFEVEAIIVSFFVKAIGLLLMPPLLFVSLWVPEELSFSSTSITILFFALCGLDFSHGLYNFAEL